MNKVQFSYTTSLENILIEHIFDTVLGLTQCYVLAMDSNSEDPHHLVLALDTDLLLSLGDGFRLSALKGIRQSLYIYFDIKIFQISCNAPFKFVLWAINTIKKYNKKTINTKLKPRHKYSVWMKQISNKNTIKWLK